MSKSDATLYVSVFFLCVWIVGAVGFVIVASDSKDGSAWGWIAVMWAGVIGMATTRIIRNKLKL